MRFWLFAGLTAPTIGCSEYRVDSADDGTGDSGTTPVTLTEPVADAGIDLSIQPLEELILDATGSYDPEGQQIVGVQWTLVDGPAGSRSEIVNARQPVATLFVDLAGVYVFELTVQDEEGLWDSTPDQLVATAFPLDGFYVELSWAASNDLDLHLLNGTSALFGPGDCSYCNMAPAWGAPGTDDDPSLDWDAIFGFGPETITIDEPGSGVFDIQVHYYGEDGLHRCRGACEPSPATVNIYLGGVLEATFERTLLAQGDLWDVATLTWPDRRIEKRNLLGHTDRTSCPE
jgi:hypothetical protein